MTNEESVTIILKEIAYIKSCVYSDDLKVTAWVEGRISALELALVALEKQIPKKLTVKIDKTIGFKTIHCPACDSMNLTDDNLLKLDFCPDCGQALDWSEE